MITTATEDSGIDILWAAVSEHHDFLVADGELHGRWARRYRAEVRSRLDYLLAQVAEDRISDLPISLDEAPGAVALRLTADLLGSDGSVP